MRVAWRHASTGYASVVLQWEDSFAVLLLYVDHQGKVSADFLEGFQVGDVLGSTVAPNGDPDRFVVNVDNRLIVLRPDGSAVVHVVKREGGRRTSDPSRSGRRWPPRAPRSA